MKSKSQSLELLLFSLLIIIFWFFLVSETYAKNSVEQSYEQGIQDTAIHNVKGSACSSKACKAAYTEGMQFQLRLEAMELK